jgi:hypothetical protein
MTTIQEIENLETFYLIWLGNSIKQEFQQQLRIIINYLSVFKDTQQCLQYLQSLSKDDRVILIVKGKLGQQIVPDIVHLRQIISIYVYCNDKKTNEQWAKNFKKVNHSFLSMFRIVFRSKELSFIVMNFFNEFNQIISNDNIINSMNHYHAIFSILKKLMKLLSIISVFILKC